jgi:two-component system osmolarity sensor histidine kinase EnvZ
MVSPLIILQLISTYVFYNTHWNRITYSLATSIAGEISAIINMMHAFPGEQNRYATFAIATTSLDLKITLNNNDILKTTDVNSLVSKNKSFNFSKSNSEKILIKAISERVDLPFYIDVCKANRDVEIRVLLPEGVLNIHASRKRLYSPTTTIFILWMTGAAFLLFGIATIFMRNQVNSVRRLAIAVDNFGKGRDVPYFKPQGASEVRQVAISFEQMRDRIKLQIDQRMEMLACISHDLRTSITRMKLALTLIKNDDITELKDDVFEMERMIKDYLNFASNESVEKTSMIDLMELLKIITGKFLRNKATIDLNCEESLFLPLRPLAISRCLTNLIDNATRYATNVSIHSERHKNIIEIIIDDNGTGIHAEHREIVFNNFVRLEESRNSKTGGIGLGLTIARDVARSHGGDILLEDSPFGGLRVKLQLPF